MTELDSGQKRNAAKIIAALSCTKLGDALMNPKTVMTWLLSRLGTSGAVLSMLVPIRESGSMALMKLVTGTRFLNCLSEAGALRGLLGIWVSVRPQSQPLGRTGGRGKEVLSSFHPAAL